MYTFVKNSYLIIIFKRLRPNQKPDGICFCSLRGESPGLREGRKMHTVVYKEAERAAQLSNR